MDLWGPDWCKRHGHCPTCLLSQSYICCECGRALVPWHPDIEAMIKDGEV